MSGVKVTNIKTPKTKNIPIKRAYNARTISRGLDNVEKM